MKQKTFSEFLIESIFDYVNKGVLDKVFEYSNIKLRTGIDDIKKQ